MKKNAFLILLITTLLSACSQSDEPIFSCNDNINQWVINNLEDISTMTRSDWKELPNEIAIAVYRAFSPKQKILFWQEKFTEVKQLEWSYEELILIQLAEDFLNSHTHLFYKKRITEDEEDELDIFYYTWSKKAMDDFKWDEKLAADIIVSRNEIRTFKTRSFEPPSNPFEPPIIQPDCSCKFDIYCHPFACEPGFCEETDDGCGVLSLARCKGLCAGTF